MVRENSGQRKITISADPRGLCFNECKAPKARYQYLHQSVYGEAVSKGVVFKLIEICIIPKIVGQLRLRMQP